MRKRNEPRVKTKYLASLCVFFILLVFTTLQVSAADLARIVLPLEQIFLQANGASYPATDTVEYSFMPLDSLNPMPEGTISGAYILHITGNDSKNIGAISYTAEGQYHYELKANLPSGFDYISQDTVFQIVIAVKSDGSATITATNQAGKKVAEIEFRYTKKSSGGSNPDGPSNPVDPVDPTDPIDPIDPTDPIDPANPVDPTGPTDPVDPTGPGSTTSSNGEKAPQTDDEKDMFRWVLLGGLAFLGFILCCYSLIRERNRRRTLK